MTELWRWVSRGLVRWGSLRTTSTAGWIECRVGGNCREAAAQHAASVGCPGARSRDGQRPTRVRPKGSRPSAARADRREAKESAGGSGTEKTGRRETAQRFAPQPRVELKVFPFARFPKMWASSPASTRRSLAFVWRIFARLLFSERAPRVMSAGRFDPRADAVAER